MPLIRKDPAAPPAPPAAETDPFVALRAGGAERRWTAARALGDRPGGVAALAAALDDERDPGVREAIFASLARNASPEAVDAVLPSLRGDDPGLRTLALDALRAMPAAVAPRLQSLLGDPDPDVRLLSCEIARDLPSAQVSALLAALLDRESLVNVCASAVEVLAEAGDATAAPALQRCAARFPDEPFLGFAVRTALHRLKPGGDSG